MFFFPMTTSLTPIHLARIVYGELFHVEVNMKVSLDPLRRSGACSVGFRIGLRHSPNPWLSFGLTEDRLLC